MRKSAFGALTSAVVAVGFVLTSAPSLVAQGAAITPTATPSSQATPISPIASSGTVLIAPLALTGSSDPTATIRAAINSLPSVPLLKNLKLTIKTAPKTFLSVEEALTAAKTPDIVAVIWDEAAADSSTSPILHFALPRRVSFESFQPKYREETTSFGLAAIPDDVQFPLDSKLDAKTLTAYTQAQLYIAFAAYNDAGNSLKTANSALADNTNIADRTPISHEIDFEQAFIAARTYTLDALDAALTTFGDLSQDSTASKQLQAYAAANAAALNIDQGDTSSAKDAVTAALAFDSNLVPALLDQGAIDQLNGDLSTAADSYTAALAADTHNEYSIFALNNRGWVSYQQQEDTASLSDFTDALKQDPNFIDVYLNRAALYRANRSYDKAIVDATAAIALDPNYEYAYSIRGNLNVRTRHYNDALSDLNKAISLNPDVSSNYENRGYVWEALGEPDKAFADYSQTISLAPTDPYPYLYRGNIYLQRADYYSAVVDEALSIQFNSNNNPALFGAYFIRAQAYRGLQRWSSALADYQKYITVTQGQGDAAELARAYIKAIHDLLTPTPTPTPTDVPTSTNTPTDTPVPPTATNTNSPTPVPSATPTATATLTVTATVTATRTATNTESPTSSQTSTVTNTPKPTNTATPTASHTPSSTPTVDGT